MVKEVTKVFQQCEICKNEFDTRAHAEQCEERGVKPYDFARFEVVRYFDGISNGRNLVADSPHAEDEVLKPHGDVDRYAVEWYRDDVGHNPNPINRRINTDVYVSRIKKTRYAKKCCPLCSSKDVALVLEEYYFHQVAANTDTLRVSNVEAMKCRNCGVTYFTDLQRLAMLRSFDEAVSAEESRKKPTLVNFLAGIIAEEMSRPPQNQNKTD